MRFLNKSSSASVICITLGRFFFSRRRPRQAACGGCPERASELAGEDRAMRFAGAAALVFAAHAAFAQSAPPEAVKELAPTGTLRAAINYGNGVLAHKGPDGEPRGVSADLSRELAKRLGVPLEFIAFTAAGKAFEAAKENKVDVLFVAIEPVRAAEVEFTPPYVLIEGAYLVLKDSPAREPADLD